MKEFFIDIYENLEVFLMLSLILILTIVFGPILLMWLLKLINGVFFS